MSDDECFEETDQRKEKGNPEIKRFASWPIRPFEDLSPGHKGW